MLEGVFIRKIKHKTVIAVLLLVIQVFGLSVVSYADASGLYNTDEAKALDGYSFEYGWDMNKYLVRTWDTGENQYTRLDTGYQYNCCEDRIALLISAMKETGYSLDLTGYNDGTVTDNVFVLFAKSLVGKKENVDKIGGTDDCIFNTWYYNKDVHNVDGNADGEYSSEDLKYPNGEYYPWSTVFISYCAANCGLISYDGERYTPGGTFVKTNNLNTLYNYLCKKQSFKVFPVSSAISFRGSSEVVPGDIVFWNNVDKVGIVSETNFNSITIISGDAENNAVVETKYTKAFQGKIVHVVYPENMEVIDAPAKEELNEVTEYKYNNAEQKYTSEDRSEMFCLYLNENEFTDETCLNIHPYYSNSNSDATYGIYVVANYPLSVEYADTTEAKLLYPEDQECYIISGRTHDIKFPYFCDCKVKVSTQTENNLYIDYLVVDLQSNNIVNVFRTVLTQKKNEWKLSDIECIDLCKNSNNSNQVVNVLTGVRRTAFEFYADVLSKYGCVKADDINEETSIIVTPVDKVYFSKLKNIDGETITSYSIEMNLESSIEKDKIKLNAVHIPTPSIGTVTLYVSAENNKTFNVVGYDFLNPTNGSSILS